MAGSSIFPCPSSRASSSARWPSTYSSPIPRIMPLFGRRREGRTVTRVVAPSGEQYEISGSGYRAVVTECGAGLRLLEHDGRPLVDGYDESAHGVRRPRAAAGAVAEPDPGRAVRRRRPAAAAAAERAGPAQRLARAGALGRVEPRGAHRPVGGPALPADGAERLPVDPGPARRLRPQRGRADRDAERDEPGGRPRAVRPGSASVPHRRPRPLRRLGADPAGRDPLAVRPGPQAPHRPGAGGRDRVRLPGGPAAAPDRARPRLHRPGAATRPAGRPSSSATRRPATRSPCGWTRRTRG